MGPVRHVVYLHGFASSPASAKARRFGRELADQNVGFSCPDFNLPAFETLTVTRMLGQVRNELAPIRRGPVALIGSSLGAFVALHAAAALPPGSPVDRLVLLAPALDFGTNRLGPLNEKDIEAWRRSRRLRVFHHAANAWRDVDFALYEDATAYDATKLDLTRPALIFQGRHDDMVDWRSVERWTCGRPRADLRLVDDGHQLAASLDVIWRESEMFLGLRNA